MILGRFKMAALIHNNKKSQDNQRCIQNAVKHLRWSHLQI